MLGLCGHPTPPPPPAHRKKCARSGWIQRKELTGTPCACTALTSSFSSSMVPYWMPLPLSYCPPSSSFCTQEFLDASGSHAKSSRDLAHALGTLRMHSTPHLMLW